MSPDEVTLKEYLDERFKSLELQIESQSRLQNQHNILNELAIKTAKENTDTRLAQMNEFREQMKDERSLYATRESVSASAGEIAALREWKSNLEGKASQSSVNTVLVISIISILIGIAGIILGIK